VRATYLLGIVVFLVVVLPLIGFLLGSGLVKLAAQVILTIVLVAVIGATGIFGYICIKAQARKWGLGLFLIAIICLLIVFWLWTGKPLLLI
jgi:positive regulator of sigma E activity